ncbi:hypothetical protein CYMTET_44189 [Cymbomonas tetramitiformis]|uniref:FHA domain-containing protein n=1 Tax=Cymbomonas tetramitiformis TaxID=36881 RepID=A0AAE0C2M5_9CHLO|nr:hypothetical protein CYMTET_44193 [Cymbomonas tetramitiformis]KAK3246270.1 hypothetical protein CYMTET_44189 [Cymbomonas tetramitiformis]
MAQAGAHCAYLRRLMPDDTPGAWFQLPACDDTVCLDGRHVYTVTDNDSTNGTYVSDVYVTCTDDRVLKNDDIVSFGGPRMCIDRTGVPYRNPYQFQFADTCDPTQVGSRNQQAALCASTQSIDEHLQCSVCHDAVFPSQFLHHLL